MNIHTKRWTAIAMLGLALSGCGGGGGAAGDVGAMSVSPNGFTWKATSCPGGVANAESIHSIIGGREPFRVRSTVAGLVVGFADRNNQFVAAQRDANGDMILTGQDPRFVIRTTLPCESEVSVIVLDAFSNNVSVSITVEGNAPVVPVP
ncbi:MAG: hypothetical protein MUF44_07235 [Hydrogenophaga sp.]|nr:hypothetical protein [Hydrogenophaga sp.]